MCRIVEHTHTQHRQTVASHILGGTQRALHNSKFCRIEQSEQMNILYSFKCIYCIVQMQMFALSRKPKDWRHTEHFTIPRLSVDLLRVLQNRSIFTVAIVYIVQCAVANVYIILSSCKCLHYLANQKIGGTRSTFAISQRTEHENSGRHWWCCK